MRLEERELQLKQFIKHIGRAIWWGCPEETDEGYQCIRIDGCIYRGEPTLYTSKKVPKKWECNLYKLRDNGNKRKYREPKNAFEIIENLKK